MHIAINILLVVIFIRGDARVVCARSTAIILHSITGKDPEKRTTWNLYGNPRLGTTNSLRGTRLEIFFLLQRSFCIFISVLLFVLRPRSFFFFLFLFLFLLLLLDAIIATTYTATALSKNVGRRPEG